MKNERTVAEAFPPGEFLSEELEARGWTQADLAAILGRPTRLVNEIVSSKRGITPETAKGLGEAFGTGAEYWMNLESAYRLAQVKADDSVARRALIYSKAPVKEMIRRGWIEASANVSVLEKSVVDFFGMGSIHEEPRALAHAARKSTTYVEVSPAQRAWLFRARELAQSVPTSRHYEPELLDECVAQLRTLTSHPQEARRVPAFLSSFGIRFLVVEHLAQTRIDGVSFWLDDLAPVIALSMRFNRIDWFWHTLMHEIGHIRSGDGRGEESPSLDLELCDDTPGVALTQTIDKEAKANRFAVETLVPQDELERFIARKGPLFATQAIAAFAQRIGVHPGIVVGQLQRRPDGIGYQHSRRLLEPVREIVVASALTDGWGQMITTQEARL